MVVEAPVKSHCAASGLGRDRLNDDGIPQRPAQALTEPRNQPSDQQQRPSHCKRERPLSEWRQSISDEDEQLSMTNLVRDIAGGQLGETCDRLCSTFDESQNSGGQAKYGQKSWQNDRCRLVAKIPESTRKSRAQDHAIEPAGRFIRVVSVGFS